ncbi:MAG: hypothetical protein K2Y35_13600 [Burkholderiales bacterium]|nr:hypothetical protein [Burkholderiales bacterium]
MRTLLRSRFPQFRHWATALSLCTLGIVPMAASAGFVASSLEQYNYQTGNSALTVRSYDAFDELDDLPGVTGLTVQVNSGPVENIAFDLFYNAYKRRQSWDSVEQMVAARPVDATIVHTLTGSPAGTVSITAPGVAYAAAVPVSPVFEIVGLDGYWTSGTHGEGIFNFDAATAGSFTIRLNPYAAATAGPNFFYSASVADIRGPYSRIDEQHSGVLPAGAPTPSLALTFTRGLPLDGGDADPTTYGFGADSFVLLEGEFGNIFGLATTGLGDGSQKAFVYQNNTSLILQAVPEPSIYACVGIGMLLIGWATRLRSPGPGRIT